MKKFKGIILAGGRGSRLSPLTDITNKFLMPVYDKLMIEYSVWSLVNAGITDIAIILGTKSAGETMDYLKSGKKYGAKFTYFYQDEPLGAAHALYQAKDWAGFDNVVVLCADNIIYDDIKQFTDKFGSGAFITTKVFKNKYELQRFAVLEFDKYILKPGLKSPAVSKLVEKPMDPGSNYAFCGIQIYDEYVWDILEDLKPSARGEFEIVDVLNKYIDMGAFSYDVLKRAWFDCGNKDALFEAQQYAYRYSKGLEVNK